MPKIVDKEKKRQKIIEAALQLFHEKGYKSVTTREIAASAGVSKGVLYDYFKNKQDLFYQTIRENMFKKLMYKEAMEDTTVTPIERFNNVKQMVTCHTDVRHKRFHMMFDFIVNCPDQQFIDEVFANLYTISRRYTSQIITDAFPQTVDNPKKAQLYSNIFIAFIDGIIFQHIVDPEKAQMNDTLDLFWKIMTAGFESPKEISATHTAQ
ncbi:TetR/AcrR family transcriptional regulator [candidate division KSB1 bacterium]